MKRFRKGEKVVVKGLDMAFVVDDYVEDDLVQLFIEGESRQGRYQIIYARPSVLRPNNYETMVEEGWVDPPEDFCI